MFAFLVDLLGLPRGPRLSMRIQSVHVRRRGEGHRLPERTVGGSFAVGPIISLGLSGFRAEGDFARGRRGEVFDTMHWRDGRAVYPVVLGASVATKLRSSSPRRLHVR